MNISLHTQGCIGRAENHTVISPHTRGCINHSIVSSFAPAHAGLYHFSLARLLCKHRATLPERRKTMDRRQITGMVLGALMLCLPLCFR